MPISFTCPHCGNNMNVADQYAGQTGPCARCNQSITIPFPKSPGFPAGPGMAPGMGPAPGPSASAGKSGTSIIVVILAVCGVVMVLCAGAVGLLVFPAIQGAREAARRAHCTNNLKQIALAMHNYHDTYKAFPPAYTVDSKGKKLHSWRVLILPFLEQGQLFNQIDLNEPWDSPRNQVVAGMMPMVYRCPSDTSNNPGGTSTNYVALTGVGAFMEDHKPRSLMDVLDGTSNTAIVVEATGSGIHWMEPRDMDIGAFVAQYGQPSGSGGHAGGGNVAYADGSVRFVPASTDPAVRQAMATRAGAEAVQVP